MARAKPPVRITVEADPTKPGVTEWLERLRALARSRSVDVTIDESLVVALQYVGYEYIFGYVKREYPATNPTQVAISMWVSLTSNQLVERSRFICSNCGLAQGSGSCNCPDLWFRSRHSRWLIKLNDLQRITLADIEGLSKMPITKGHLWTFLEGLRD